MCLKLCSRKHDSAMAAYNTGSWWGLKDDVPKHGIGRVGIMSVNALLCHAMDMPLGEACACDVVINVCAFVCAFVQSSDKN